MQNNNEPTNKLEELESACEETKISSIAKKKQKLAQQGRPARPANSLVLRQHRRNRS